MILIPYLLVQYYTIQLMIMLCRKGTSSEVKRYVLIRHFTYKVLFDFYVINIYLLMEGTEGIDPEYEQVF